MKTSQNKKARLEIRLAEEDLKLLKIAAYTLGQTPSQLIRIFVDSTINAFKIKVKKGELNIEDFEAVLDD